MAMEVVTTHDKAKRDQMFQELRNSDQANERQVVKFSGNEPVLRDGKPTYDGALRQDGTIKEHSRGRSRQLFRSTCSVAYPTN